MFWYEEMKINILRAHTIMQLTRLAKEIVKLSENQSLVNTEVT